MDPEIIENLKEIFANVDRTGEGRIATEEIGFFFRSAGLNPSSVDVEQVVKEINSQSVTFEIAVTFIRDMATKQEVPNRQMFIDVFRIWDRDCNGLIPIAEFSNVLTSLGDPLLPEELKSLMSNFEDRNGFVKYEELVDFVLKH